MKKGFTLIELLIVIAIIGILIAVAVFGSQNAFKSARDTQRKSDLKQYQTSLESFANKNNGLFASTSGSDVDPSGTLCSTYLGSSNCPTDPDTAASWRYHYVSNGTGSYSATATQYVLWAQIETDTNPSCYSCPSYNVVCSNGKSLSFDSTDFSVTANADCPF